MAGEQRQRIAYLDLLRCGAAAAVVLLHASGLEWGLTDPHTRGWRELAYLDAATRWCVPIFFMLTGALFLRRRRQPTWNSLLRRSIPRLLGALVFWGLVYSWFDPFLKGQEFERDGALRTLPVSYYHLWFLPVMIGVYLVLPVLWWIFRERRLAKGMVILWAAFMSANSLAPFEPTGILWRALEWVTPPQVTGYAMFVLLGGLLATTDRRPPPGWLVGLFAGSVLGIGALTLWDSARRAEHIFVWFEYETPLVVTSAVAVFLLAQRSEPWLQLHPRLAARLGQLGSLAFGVYLVHPMLLGLLRQQTIPLERGLGRSLLFWLGTSATSMLLVWLLRLVRPLRERIV
ncbi:acyltransferase [Luteococcus sp. Sow4_B9]|uniref:acyltransferase n=1 Tax=Luteococcus sp. Sow4_B9 TaxID=3438792 RepID=UPI003F9C0888